MSISTIQSGPPHFAHRSQIRHSPYSAHIEWTSETVKLCHELGITVSAFKVLTPLTKDKGRPVTPVVEAISQKHGATQAQVQVLLAWAAQTLGGPIGT